MDTFLKFLRRVIKDAGRKVFLIVDNLRVHNAKKVRKWIDKHKDKIEIFFLPPSPFDACRKRSTRASSLSLVRFDDNDYSVPVAYAHHEILAKG